MATQFFLIDSASDLGGAGQKTLSTSRGVASVNAITTTTSGGTNIQATATGGGQALTWFTPPLQAVTISGTVTVNIRGKEAANTVNAGAGVLIERCNGAGVVQSAIVADSTVPGTITEYSTSDAAKNGTYTPTSTSLAAGDRIKVTVKVRNSGTMGANASGVTNTYNGPTAAVAGDTYVTFTETVLPLVTTVGHISPTVAGRPVNPGREAPSILSGG